MNNTSRMALAAGLLALLGSGTASAVAVSGQGTWETTLQARDIDHDGFVDAFYDTSSNLTWLADANAIKTTNYTPGDPLNPQPSGAISWFAVYNWAAHLNVDGVTGWRLPTLVDKATCYYPGSHAVCSTAVTPGTSELENLLEKTLGNQNGQLTNTGLFSNVQAGQYWTQTSVSGYPIGSTPIWTYNTANGEHVQGYQSVSATYFAWAVHTGDIAAAVPEPSTYALAIAGLAVTCFARRRSAKQPG